MLDSWGHQFGLVRTLDKLMRNCDKRHESRGGPKNCWCMVWRGTTKDRADKNSRKTAFRHLVEEDVPVGILGYLDDVPIAWSIACFFVSRKYRGQGIMNRLINAAVEHSFQRGATVVEAYPADPDSPSYRFMGFAPYFEERGFVKVGIAGSRRQVMRLKQ